MTEAEQFEQAVTATLWGLRNSVLSLHIYQAISQVSHDEFHTTLTFLGLYL